MFGRHGRFGRAGGIRGTLYDDVVHIPLIIKKPQFKGKRVSGLVQIIDVAPTLLYILDLPAKYNFQGKNLISLIMDNFQVNDYVYSGLEYRGSDTFSLPKTINESIRNSKWKLIREVVFIDRQAQRSKDAVEENYELYDLTTDPKELNNLIDKEIEIASDLKRKLKEWVRKNKNFSLDNPLTRKLPQDFIENAKKRGYW